MSEQPKSFYFSGSYAENISKTFRYMLSVKTLCIATQCYEGNKLTMQLHEETAQSSEPL